MIETTASMNTDTLPQPDALSNTDALAEAAGDAALVAVLSAKPADDAVPTSVWWLVAEALRTSVTVRRRLATTGTATVHDEDLAVLLTEARLLTDIALDELATVADVHPTLVVMPLAAVHRPLSRMRESSLTLARLLVTHRATAPGHLANALAAHRRALGLVRTERPVPEQAGRATG